MKRFLTVTTIAACALTFTAAHASPLAFKQNSTYPAHLWFTLDKLKAEAAAIEDTSNEDEDSK